MSNLKRGEITYCILVLTSFVGAFLPMPAGISAFLGLVVFSLFPIGVAMEFRYARYPIPVVVALCLLLTGLWAILVIASIKLP